MEFDAPAQPTETDVKDNTAEWRARKRLGTPIVEFYFAHLGRDDDTGEVMIGADTPVTSEIARQYEPAFRETAARPELGLGRDATNLTAEEISAFALFLGARASEVEPSDC